MSAFNYSIVHKPGKGNIADFLSRHPILAKECDKLDDETMINRLISYYKPSAISVEELSKECKADAQYRQLAECIKKGVIPSACKNLDQFKLVFDELTLTNSSIILREDRVLIPEPLRMRVIDLAHEGHLGEQKTKNLLRSKVWFPKMDKLVESRIKNCMACQASTSKGTHIAPLQMSALPNSPWESVSMDFYGPYEGVYLQVLVDDFSGFPIVDEISNVSFRTVSTKLEQTFALFGIPLRLKSDNGAPFQGKDFEIFCNFFGCKHQKITPRWPRANGKCENFMKNLGKVLKTAHVDKVPWRARLLEFLRTYRSTPHSSTKVAPADLIFSFSRTARLPELNIRRADPKIFNEAKSNFNESQAKNKQYNDAYLKTKNVSLNVGDTVLVSQDKKNKATTPFEPHKYQIIKKNGTMLTARRNSDGRTTTRNVSFFKKWRGEGHTQMLSPNPKPTPTKKVMPMHTFPLIQDTPADLSEDDEDGNVVEDGGGADNLARQQDEETEDENLLDNSDDDLPDTVEDNGDQPDLTGDQPDLTLSTHDDQELSDEHKSDEVESPGRVLRPRTQVNYKETRAYTKRTDKQ